MENLISIITPLYNAEKYIEETINSVLNQTHKNWEMIIVDDCSKDNSLILAKKFESKDNRIKVFSLTNNGGSAVARNYGLKQAKGRYITFLDADDLLDINYLESQLMFIKDTNAAVVSSAYRRMAKTTTTDFYVPESVDYKLLLKGNPISCLSTIYDKQKVGERYFPEDLRKCEDYVFWLNIAKEGFIFKGNKNVLATYRILEGSKSRNKGKLIKYMYNVYHKTQNINWFKSWFCVLRWAIYGLKKYKDVM